MTNPSAEVAATLDQIVQTRRSQRVFSPEPVDRAEVARILKLSAMAPSAWNLQPWRFVVVTDPSIKADLQVASHGQKQVGQAPVVVALYCDMLEALGRIDDALNPSMPLEAKKAFKANITDTFGSMPTEARDAWGNAQGNIALGYLLLLFEVHGFATSPMLGFDPPSVRRILDLPDHATIPALIAIGKPGPDKLGPPHRFPFDELVRFVGDST